MARNSEKAMLMLNRWHEMKLAVTGGIRRRRPRATEEVDSVKDAEYWRSHLIREISVKIAEIQNASLGETRLRELNDEINRLLKEKDGWESQIQKLGPQQGEKGMESMFEGGCVTTKDGYKYFGAAKELKSVRELDLNYQAGSETRKPRTRAEIVSILKPSYYSWDPDSPALLEEEAEIEAKMLSLVDTTNEANEFPFLPNQTSSPTVQFMPDDQQSYSTIHA